MNRTARAFLIAVGIAAVAIVAFWVTKNSFTTSRGTIIIAEGTQPVAAPVYVAYAKGYFIAQGLDVELASFPTGKLSLDALLGGKAHFATVAETPIMHASFKNQPIKIVTTMHWSRQNTFCIASKEQGIQAPSDLKGKIVAVPFGTNAEYGLSAFLSKHGLAPSDLKLINLSPPEMIGPITNGDVAAVVAWQPHGGRCEKALGEKSIRFSFDEVYEETYNLVTSTEITRTKKAMVIKVLRALSQAITFMAEKPKEAIDIVAQRISMENAELASLWHIYDFGLNLRSTLIDTLLSEGKWAVESGHQAGAVPDMLNIVSAEALRLVKPEAVDLPRPK